VSQAVNLALLFQVSILRIDPTAHYDAQAFARKVVPITGAYRGTSFEVALQSARAGATLTRVARNKAALDASRDAILRVRPSAHILTFPADMRDVKKAEEAILTTVALFGRLDIVVANAAILRPMEKRTLTPHAVLF
jgi:NAD(P)-dependent dehydrogenase (short-subunit alcohol dehydrogenase family)